MLRRFIFSGLVSGAFILNVVPGLSVSVVADEKAEKSEVEKAPAEDTQKVKHKDLELSLPTTWKVAPSSSSMRLATYVIPAAEGDKETGEFAIFTFPGGGGDLNENLTRWIEQFSSDGRQSVLKQGKVGENHYYVADITGTYNKPKGPPVLRQTEPAEGYRMLAIVVELEGKGVYYLKATGPEATIKANLEVLRKSFGAKSDGETDYEI